MVRCAALRAERRHNPDSNAPYVPVALRFAAQTGRLVLASCTKLRQKNTEGRGIGRIAG